jgi:hypothetical protein
MQFIAILIVAALWAKCGLVLIAIVAGAYALHRVVCMMRASTADAKAAAVAEADRWDRLGARADQQHAWVMLGDPRGTYGESTTAPM